MTYTLFLDDLRDPTWDLGEDVLIARNVRQAIKLVEEMGMPAVISFDHDLGKNEPIAVQFMWWLVDRHLDGDHDLSTIKEIIIHSANPVGAANLAGLWDGFASNELATGVRAQLKPRH